MSIWPHQRGTDSHHMLLYTQVNTFTYVRITVFTFWRNLTALTNTDMPQQFAHISPYDPNKMNKGFTRSPWGHGQKRAHLLRITNGQRRTTAILLYPPFMLNDDRLYRPAYVTRAYAYSDKKEAASMHTCTCCCKLYPQSRKCLHLPVGESAYTIVDSVFSTTLRYTRYSLTKHVWTAIVSRSTCNTFNLSLPPTINQTFTRLPIYCLQHEGLQMPASQQTKISVPPRNWILCLHVTQKKNSSPLFAM